MLVSGAFSLVHMIAALYIVKKVQEDTTTDNGGSSAMDNGFVKVENEQPILTAAVVGRLWSSIGAPHIDGHVTILNRGHNDSDRSYH